MCNEPVGMRKVKTIMNDTGLYKLVKSAYQKINFLISQPKYMLWVLKKTVSMRGFFCAPKTYAKHYG